MPFRYSGTKAFKNDVPFVSLLNYFPNQYYGTIKFTCIPQSTHAHIDSVEVSFQLKSAGLMLA